MAWRDQLLPASFRGVPFEIDEHEHEFGRRNVTHEYPLRDKPYNEDLGRKTRRWTITAYVAGPDYMQGRDDLIAAIETEGPGRLVHPYLGEKLVAVETSTVGESSGAGGLAAFNLVFVETGENLAPAISDDTQELALNAADEASETLLSGFEDTYPQVLPGWAPPSIGGVIAAAADAMRDALAVIASVDAVGDLVISQLSAAAQYGVFSTLSGQLQPTGPSAKLLGRAGVARYAVARKAEALKAQGAVLASSPADLSVAIADLVGSVAALKPNSARAARGLAPLMAFQTDVADVPGVTPGRRAEQQAIGCVRRLTRHLAAVESCRVAARREYDSYDQAMNARNRLADDMEDLVIAASDAGDAAAAGALTSLRTAMARDLLTRAAPLRRTTRLTTGANMPALVLAHALYNDAGRADE
ncbi:MAG: DNA circularization protein, partial [Caulobacteraceae bacterium]